MEKILYFIFYILYFIFHKNIENSTEKKIKAIKF